MICPDAGMLGRTVKHPGPVVGYSWQQFVLPTWMIEQARVDAERSVKPLERAVLQSIVAESIPMHPLVP